MPTNDHDLHQPGEPDIKGHTSESPGYETTDVNVNGVLVFLAGLGGFLIVFFVFCFVMGRVINGAIQKADGPTTKWNHTSDFAGAALNGGKRQDLTSDPVMEQKQLQQLTATFPTPRLDIDDGEQSTADLHAREDLLLNYYSTSPGEGSNIRIPITRAMELIAQRGLPVNTSTAATEPLMAGDEKPEIQAPLTTGFARTGYELDTIEARAEKMAYGKAESEAHPDRAH
ncbi:MULTISPECIES: hypothetical protein [Acidobacteriaceae]|uniref:hypothetical protein n=1 Tax=Acidobacteriaceae TaxID=204434 RepID=UPI00131D523F|nr:MULTISPECIES: hypothetical protein [Acidobacteriaceae]MDW5265749.1 hypothetical protein [Edaphobacter sp.]